VVREIFEKQHRAHFWDTLYSIVHSVKLKLCIAFIFGISNNFNKVAYVIYSRTCVVQNEFVRRDLIEISE